jgi:hypothetical protein
MVQCDKGLHPAFAQRAQHVGIMLNGGQIEFPAHWLDTAPLHRKTVGIVVHLGGTIKVLDIAPTPPITCLPRDVFAVDAAQRLFPHGPVIRGNTTFDLVRGRGCTP